MKIKSINYLMSRGAVFNPIEVPKFSVMDNNHSSLLWSALFINAYEVLSTYPSSPLILLIDQKDKDFLPSKISGTQENILFMDFDDRPAFFKGLNEKYVSNYDNNLLFFSNSIGYSHQDLNRTQNLLNMNDDAIVLAKSENNKICFTGFNSYLDFLEKDETDYNKVLTDSCRHNSFIHTLDNYISVNEVNDFRKLYNELSKKESLSYCSQEMHEQFTHLFVEYKELLK